MLGTFPLISTPSLGQGNTCSIVFNGGDGNFSRIQSVSGNVLEANCLNPTSAATTASTSELRRLSFRFAAASLSNWWPRGSSRSPNTFAATNSAVSFVQGINERENTILR